MTIDAAMAIAERELDGFISRHLQAHEARMRAAPIATGPEDQAALDRPADPESPWRRATIEECLSEAAHRLAAWREQVLEELRNELTADYQETGAVSDLHRVYP
jgi:hypothetical protein